MNDIGGIKVLPNKNTKFFQANSVGLIKKDYRFKEFLKKSKEIKN